MVNRAITFIVYALIARYLGPYEFGQMSLTLTIFYLLQSLAPVGLKILLVRDVAKNKERSGEYLVNGSLVAFITSVFAFLLMGCFLLLMKYSRDTVGIILVVSLGLIPYSITAVCEALLQSHEKIKYITAANVPVSMVRGIAAFAMLAGGLSLIWIGVLFFVTFTATLVFEWLLVSKNVASPVWNIDMPLLRQIGKLSITFLGLQTVIAVTGSILPIFLSKSAGEVEVGLLTAANQLMAPILLISQSTVMSLFPRMCQKFDSSPDGLGKISERLLEILFTFTLPCTIGLFFFAEQALLILYEKTAFTQSTMILQIMVWILIFRAITSVLGRVLMASQRERTLLKIMIAEAVLTLALCFWLIPGWKLAGAAYVAIIIGLLDLILHISFTWRVAGNIHYGRSFWKPVLASMVMSGIILLSRDNDVNIWITILIAGAGYTISWLILAILENGSWPRVLQHYQVRQ
jgi:O-antigen/teichoic acid export membrane protein